MSISRRTVVQGAAWSVPVLAVASVAPVASASPFPIDFDSAGAGGKCPGNGVGCDLAHKSYIFPLEITSSYASGVNVTVTATLNGTTYPIDVWGLPGDTELHYLTNGQIYVPGGTSYITLGVIQQTNSPNVKGATFNLSFIDPNTGETQEYSIYVPYTKPSHEQCADFYCDATITEESAAEEAPSDAPAEDTATDAAAEETGAATDTTESAAPADTTATETPVEDPTAEATPVDTATDAG